MSGRDPLGAPAPPPASAEGGIRPAAAATGRLVLASASPRRRELLESLDLDFTVRPAAVDETPYAGERPRDLVRRLAREKAEAVARDGEWVLAADTIVVEDGAILGKPADRDEARKMLERLQNRWHDWYAATGEPDDKAGAYAVQGLGSLFILEIDGNYGNVVGLPLPTVRQLFEGAGSDVRTFRRRPLGARVF